MFTEAQASAYKSALVRFYQESKVIGAGLYFSRGCILTCAHIATQSLNLGKKPQAIALEAVAGKRLKVDFPFVAPMQFQEAEVVPSLWRFNDEDLAILKIEASPEGALPLALSTSTYYRNNPYHVCGFPDGHPNGLWTQGVFLDEQAKGWVQIEDTKAQGVPIEPGFSGAPVWDEQLGGIAGITVARDQDREEAKVGFMISYQKLKLALEAAALFGLLLPESAGLTPHWQAAYKLLRPENITEAYPKTLEAAILSAQDLSSQGSEYRVIDQLIGYLALPELGLPVQPQLLLWLKEQVAAVEALLETVRQRKAAQQAQRAVGTTHLLFWVQEELNSDRYHTQAYLVPNRAQYDSATLTGVTQLKDLAQLLEAEADEKISLSQLEQALQFCLNESLESMPLEQDTLPPIQVDIFLPRRGLVWQIDQWHAEPKDEYTLRPEPVGSCCNVVLRFADRLQASTPQKQQRWKAKWSRLSSRAETPAATGLVDGDAKDIAALNDDLLTEGVVGWRRRQPPDSVAGSNPCQFSIMVGTGAPVAIWLRQHLPDYEQPFIQLLGGSLYELPARVSRLRAEAFRRNDQQTPHIGEVIGLIWEDPHLLPPGAVKPSRLRMSA